eukprot:CAMPEP_0119541962 /NCGR_PEP_ID=MMETSP1344-20130328/53295_1 /TAXON_ID=236787 /ORGANISM="Florenciella parvula, Strain CCMP2471" /LENGTH=90 /DNA_ID=CAMNT_0007586079 /DNA_START=47 /DNA_END=317 /DNA_ORIENTATION=-
MYLREADDQTWTYRRGHGGPRRLAAAASDSYTNEPRHSPPFQYASTAHRHHARHLQPSPQAGQQPCAAAHEGILLLWSFAPTEIPMREPQ